ncbi:DoxX family protein [Halostella litorea]|uniref:DoxX family protein n=1 Tax=Halostella litorea TaxID=2528831 RepID=UPI001092C01F|nr:DoxX family membrane protein [Halostella litorea]
MALALSPAGEVLFLAARVLFGGVLAFMGLNHFTDAESMAGYAGAKGVPAAGIMVPFTGGMLLVGGLLVAAGAYPLVGAGALAAFLLVATPKMHDFWNAGDPQERQNETISFLKNVGLLGTALAFLALSAEAWPYAVGL